MSRPFGLGRLPSRRELETVQTLNISSLQWLVGAFIATLGALMLVSPHQFAAPPYAYLSPHLAWFGPGFLLAGAGLIAVANPAPPFAFRLLAHASAGAVLLMLAVGFALSGSWSGTSNYGVLGLGTALAPLLVHVRTKRADHTPGDAFSILIGLATTVTTAPAAARLRLAAHPARAGIGRGGRGEYQPSRLRRTSTWSSCATTPARWAD